MVALADWRTPSAYPPEGDATLLARWHWEFLRRNENYQRDYLRFSLLASKGDAASEERKRIAARYGLDGIMFDFRDPLESLFTSPRRADALRMIRWDTRWIEDEKGNRSEADPDDHEYLTPRLRQHECCIVFSLRAPIDVQLNAAKRRLEKEFSRFESKRGKVAQYQFFLRLLDADADGVSAEALARNFFPDADLPIGLRNIETALESAKLLRDVNYRYI